MLVIKNIDKIKGKQITEKWEVYDVNELDDRYIFTISNVGYYKNITWYFTLDRFKDEVLDRYRIRTNNNNKDYEYLITTISINPTELIYYMHSIMNNIKKDNDANNT
jgi:hypothetical protein